MSDYNSSLPIRTENAGDVIAKIADATVPSQQLAVNSDGSVNITDNGGSITVDGSVTVSATNLDIRDLTHVSDSVKVGDGTDFLEVNNDGSINVAFAAGAEIKITDGTDDLAINNDGSINAVVSATNLDIRDLTHASDSIKVGDGTDFLAVNNDGSINSVVSATNLDIRDLSAAQDNVAISDGTDTLAVNSDGSINITDNGGSITVDGSVTVSATNLDIRDLSHTQDSVKIGDGTDFLAINSDGSINVVAQEDAGTEIVNYNTSSALAANATSNHDYTAAAAAKLFQVWASASGKLKIEVQVETAAASGTFNTIAVGFNSTANPNIDIRLSKYRAVPNGAKVRVIRTNKDNQSQDVYSTIIALEG